MTRTLMVFIFPAGFGKRVMFGSDQMVWPETLEGMHAAGDQQ